MKLEASTIESFKVFAVNCFDAEESLLCASISMGFFCFGWEIHYSEQ